MNRRASDINNFQGRYMILHPWHGEMNCASPRRGAGARHRPAGSSSTIAPATNIAFAPRGSVAARVADRQGRAGRTGLDEHTPITLPPARAAPQACGGCETRGPTGGGSFALIGLVGLALRRRRR